MTRKKLVVIDGKSVFYRGYYAMPDLTLPDGTPSGGVYGFAMLAFEMLKKYKPDYMAVAWDKSKTNIRSRRKLYPEYKAGRKPMPDDMRVQIPMLRELMDAFNWPFYELDDYEADDILGALALKADAQDVDTILATSDLDALQLVNKHTHVAALKRGLTNVEYFDEEYFTEKYNMTTEQFIDYKALRGDSSDNIPGIKGVGEKTAKQLLADYNSLDGVYEHADEIGGAIGKKIRADKDMAYLSKRLVTIMVDAPVEFEENASKISNVDVGELKNKLKEYKFRSLLRQVDDLFGEGQVVSEPEAPLIELGKDAAATDSVDSSKPLVVFEIDKQLYASDSDSSVAAIQPTMLGDSPKLIGHDLKNILKTIWGSETPLECVQHDTKIVAFVLDALRRETEFASLVFDELHAEVDGSSPEQTTDALWQLYKAQRVKLTETPELERVADEIDLPSIPLLARLESRGIAADASQLAALKIEFEDVILDIEQTIFGLADEEFNIASTQQLSDVLFNRMGLPTKGIKKNKSGYSTAASELDKLAGQHDIIEHIKRYREYTKLMNTYVESLPKTIMDDGRIHTTFSLTTAQTGRLSSYDPNLQNIPVRTELGRRIRSVFVAPKGKTFISADYSQFEIRLAAALSGDKGMIETFNQGLDIHKQTAAQVQGVAIEEVTKEMRYAAKAVNFGIMYGLSAHGLSVQTGMTRDEAKVFIDKYFAVRQTLKDYLDSLVQSA